MKRINGLLLCALFLICVISCKKGEQKADVSNVPVKVTEDRARAYATIDFRKKEGEKLSSSFMAYPWEYEFVFKNKEMSKLGDYAGEWVHFKEDFTYEYGSYQMTKGSGTYHHSMTNLKLLMLDNDVSIKPEEYETKFGTDVMILVGQSSFESNGVQMKLNKVTERPAK